MKKNDNEVMAYGVATEFVMDTAKIRKWEQLEGYIAVSPHDPFLIAVFDTREHARTGRKAIKNMGVQVGDIRKIYIPANYTFEKKVKTEEEYKVEYMANCELEVGKRYETIINTLNTENERLRGQNERLTKSMNTIKEDKDKIISLKEKQIRELTKELNRLEHQVDRLNQKITELNYK